MVVRLDKALYGCVESAALWNRNVTSTLLRDMFLQNLYDRCVFNKTIEGVQCTVGVHVDDLLITCISRKLIDDVIDNLRIVYGDLRGVDGPLIGYLGMTMDFSNKVAFGITMSGFVDDLLGTSGVEVLAVTPAADMLFDVRDPV